MFCPQCGTENKIGARFCKKCGAPLAPTSPVPAQPAETDGPVSAAGGVPANDRSRKVRAAAAGAAVGLAVAAVLFLLQGVPGPHPSATDAHGSADGALAGSSAGQAGGTSDASASDGSDGDGSGAPSLTDEQKMYIAYGEVLDRADTLDYYQDREERNFIGYRYFLADMTGAGTPSLVVVRAYTNAKAYLYAACVFTYDPVTGEARSNAGFDLNWGYRVSGTIDSSGVGITTYQPSDNNHTVHYIVQDGALVAQDGAGSPGDDITMYDVNDRSPLGGATDGILPGTDARRDLEAAKAEAEADGLVVYQGTGRIMSGHDLLELTVGTDAMPDGAYAMVADQTYAALILDPAAEVTCAQSGDPGMRTNEASLINLGPNYIAQMQPFDGKAVTVAIDPEHTLWPSEVRVQGGNPEVYKGARVLG